MMSTYKHRYTYKHKKPVVSNFKALLGWEKIEGKEQKGPIYSMITDIINDLCRIEHGTIYKPNRIYHYLVKIK